MSLFDSVLTSEQHAALDAGHAAAERAAEHANVEWLHHAEWIIRTMEPGHTFLAEEIAEACARGHFHTTDARALGHVIQTAKARRWIVATGDARPAKSSHGSLKPLWCRTEAS